MSVSTIINSTDTLFYTGRVVLGVLRLGCELSVTIAAIAAMGYIFLG